nr:Hsp33 family molecular chaperone HslO [Deinobacterium chartae]
MLRGTAADYTLRVLAVDSGSLVQEALDRHHLSPTATAALGRALTGALLMAQVLNKHERSRVTLRIQGDGPVGWIVAEGSPDGSVRGYVKNPQADLPARESDGKLDVGGLVGEGDLGVTRLLENTEPYTSTTPLQSGEIADDLAYFLARSEQIPSALLLGVYLEGAGVHTAGGLLIQAMPGASDETLARLEANIARLGSMTTALRAGSLLEVVQRATEGLGLEIHEQAMPVRFECRCSEEKALSALAYFDRSERLDMIDQGGQEVVCHWCGHHYHISPEQIRGLEDEGSHIQA